MPSRVAFVSPTFGIFVREINENWVHVTRLPRAPSHSHMFPGTGERGEVGGAKGGMGAGGGGGKGGAGGDPGGNFFNWAENWNIWRRKR